MCITRFVAINEKIFFSKLLIIIFLNWKRLLIILTFLLIVCLVKRDDWLFDLCSWFHTKIVAINFEPQYHLIISWQSHMKLFVNMLVILNKLCSWHLTFGARLNTGFFSWCACVTCYRILSNRNQNEHLQCYTQFMCMCERARFRYRIQNCPIILNKRQ